MTGMLSIHKGYDVDYLTRSVGETVGYLLDAKGEPPGFWTGRGAADLGLSGDVDAEVMKALYERGKAPDGRQLGRSRSKYDGMREGLEERVEAAVQDEIAREGGFITLDRIEEIRSQERAKLRNSVRFWDFTWSCVKSVSLAQAGYLAAARRCRDAGDTKGLDENERKAELINDAVRDTARYIVRVFEEQACYTRTGHHGSGEGEWRDGRGAVAAAFLQHTSRHGDPQLHCHIAVLNLVQRADGADEAYRTLDSDSFLKPGARLDIAACGNRFLERRLRELGLGLVQREDSNGFEVGGISQETMEAFSSRRTDVTPEIEGLVASYEAKYGRKPSRRDLWAMRQHATLKTRARKPEAVLPPEEELAAWEAKAAACDVQALAEIPGAVAGFARLHGAPARLEEPARHRAIRIALASVQQNNSTWTAGQLLWELHRALPGLPADEDPEPLLRQMLAEALGNHVPEAEVIPLAPWQDITDLTRLGVRTSDGQSVLRRPITGRFCTADHLDREDYLLSAGAKRLRPAMTKAEAAAALEGSDLGEDQREAAEILLRGRRAVTVFVGPAGTGKSHTLAAFARAWTAQTGGRVIGLALATNAARVLQDEGLRESFTIADFLGKLKGTDETRGHRAVRRGDVLVVDEATQVPTRELSVIYAIAEAYGARVVLTGDTEQLASPAAGGLMRLIAKDHGYVQIREVRRFDETWERPASLRLRSGDASVLPLYQQHGRIREGRADDVAARAVRLWLGDHLAGKNSLLMAATNEEAAELAHAARRKLIELGQVARGSEVVLSDGNDASTGDLVRARENTRVNAGGRRLANRDVLQLTGWWDRVVNRQAIMRRQLEGGRWTKPFTVPESYLRQHAELAYAGNTHVAQSKTVDTGHLLVSSDMGREGFYVGMTRGRERNTAHVVTSHPVGDHLGGTRPDPDLGGREAHDEATTAEAVLANIMAREAENDLTATEVMRRAMDYPASMPHLHAVWKQTTREQAFPAYDRALCGRLAPGDYARYLKDPERPVLHHQLRATELAGHDMGQVLDQVTTRDMRGARSVAAVLHGRMARLGLHGTGRTTTYAERTPPLADPELKRISGTMAQAMDSRARMLGERLAERPEPWAVRYLGMPPLQEGSLREDWISRAGLVAAYRELTRQTDKVEAIGRLPETGAPELRESWAASARALEMREEEAQLREANRGELEARVQVYERALPWAPRHVAGDLQQVTEAAADARARAEIARARQARTRKEAHAAQAQAAEKLGAELAARRELLAEAQQARQMWAQMNEARRVAASQAQAELAHRAGLQPPEATVELAGEPETDAAILQRAREAVERMDAERLSGAYQADVDEAAAWRQQAEADAAAVWQPGTAPADPQAELDLEAEPR